MSFPINSTVIEKERERKNRKEKEKILVLGEKERKILSLKNLNPQCCSNLLI
jgi:hypothetical protein